MPLRARGDFYVFGTNSKMGIATAERYLPLGNEAAAEELEWGW